MVRADTHTTLALALEVLIGDAGSLPLRLRAVAPVITGLPEDAFAVGRLRWEFRRLRSDLMAAGGNPNPRVAKALAIRFVGLCAEVALRESEPG